MDAIAALLLLQCYSHAVGCCCGSRGHVYGLSGSSSKTSFTVTAALVLATAIPMDATAAHMRAIVTDGFMGVMLLGQCARRHEMGPWCDILVLTCLGADRQQQRCSRDVFAQPAWPGHWYLIVPLYFELSPVLLEVT